MFTGNRTLKRMDTCLPVYVLACDFNLASKWKRFDLLCKDYEYGQFSKNDNIK